MKRHRGATLVEILIASVLTSLVMGVGYSLVLLVNRCQQRLAARVSTVVNAKVGLDRIRGEMQETSLTSLSISNNTLSFATARDSSGHFITDDQGAPLWQSTIIFYVDPKEKVLRQRRLPGSPSRVKAQMESLDHGGQVVAYGISGLSCVVSKNGQATLDLSCETGNGQRLNVMELSTDFAVSNP